MRIAISLAALGMLALALPAHAQNVRSWVASYGLDSNPCSRSQPCATFIAALGKTNAGGEINCVDSGEFASSGFLIGKSITIDCEGVQGRVLNSNAGDGGIYVDAPGDVVVLRGLDIGGAGTGAAGVSFVEGAGLHIEKCVIHDFVANTFGWGIAAQAFVSGPLVLYVSDTSLLNNGVGSQGAGILVQSQAPSAIIKVVLNRVDVRGNFFGIKADGTQTTGGVVQMTIRDSVSSGNASNGIVGTGTTSGAAILMMIDRSTSSHNSAGFGVIADGPRTTIRLGGSSIAGNINGVGVSNGGVVQSYGTNQINGNSNDGIAALTPIGLH